MGKRSFCRRRWRTRFTWCRLAWPSAVQVWPPDIHLSCPSMSTGRTAGHICRATTSWNVDHPSCGVTTRARRPSYTRTEINEWYRQWSIIVELCNFQLEKGEEHTVQLLSWRRVRHFFVLFMFTLGFELVFFDRRHLNTLVQSCRCHVGFVIGKKDGKKETSFMPIRFPDPKL